MGFSEIIYFSSPFFSHLLLCISNCSGNLKCIYRTDGYRESGQKKIVIGSLFVMGLDYLIDSDYCIFPVLLVEMDETTENFEEVLAWHAQEVFCICRHLDLIH
jgi:hypothetical protein